MINPPVYIVIVNYLQWDDTISCLRSVLESDYDHYSVIIIDNKSPNNSSEELISQMHELAGAHKKTFGIIEKKDVSKLANLTDQPNLVFFAK